MRMYQDERRLDFHALGREIKRKREAKGWTQEYLAQLVDRTPRSIMYFENRGQHPSLNTFYQIVTLLDISVAAYSALTVGKNRNTTDIGITIFCGMCIFSIAATNSLTVVVLTR